MIKLTLEQRNRLIYTAIGTVAVLVGTYFALISSQLSTKARYRSEADKARTRLEEAKKLNKQRGDVQKELEEESNRLSQIESDLMVPSAKVTQWAQKTVSDFVAGYDVALKDFSSPILGDVGSIPDFPYSAATYKIICQGYFHNFGKFLADFENKYRYFRFQKLSIKRVAAEGGKGAAAAMPGIDGERLEFTLDLVALVSKQPEKQREP